MLRRWSYFPALLLVTVVVVGAAGVFAHAESDDGLLPETVTSTHFQSLLNRSPFTRDLNLSGSLVLTGVAAVGGKTVVTVISTESGRSMSISTSPNHTGWKLVEVRKPNDLDLAVAMISDGAGEEIRVYHDKEKIRAAVVQLQREIQKRLSPAQLLASVGQYSLPGWVDDIKDPSERGQAIGRMIEQGVFDQTPFEPLKVALSQSDPKTRGPVLSAAFGRITGGSKVEFDTVVNHLNSLSKGRDRDFAINGLAHGLVAKDPVEALTWANSISNEGFRKAVVKNVTRRIDTR